MKMKLHAGLIFALRLVLKQRHKRTRKWLTSFQAMDNRRDWIATWEKFMTSQTFFFFFFINKYDELLQYIGYKKKRKINK